MERKTQHLDNEEPGRRDLFAAAALLGLTMRPNEHLVDHSSDIAKSAAMLADSLCEALGDPDEEDDEGSDDEDD